MFLEKKKHKAINSVIIITVGSKLFFVDKAAGFENVSKTL